MKILVINQGPFPYSGSNGCSLQLFSIIKSFCAIGHKVRLVSFETSFVDVDKTEALKTLMNLGVKTHLIDIQKQQKKVNICKKILITLLKPELTEYSGSLVKNEIDSIINEFQPDHIFAYTFNALTAYDLNKYKIKHSVSLIDVDWLVYKYRYAYRDNRNDKKNTIRHLLSYYKIWRLKNFIIKRLGLVDICFQHAAHHADYFRSRGIKNVHYFPVNVSPVNFDQRITNIEFPIQIALLGNVNTIASLSGLDFFLIKLIPVLVHMKDFSKLQFNIYGGGELKPYLRKIVDEYPNISRKGYLKEITTLYEINHIVFVPTNIPLGFRTRIVEAFSFGKGVVTHQVNKLGMPEIENGMNAFVGNNSHDFVRIFEKLIADPQLINFLGMNARKTYLEKLNGDVNTQKMAGLINELYSFKS